MYEIVTKTTFQDHLRAQELEKKYLPLDTIASAQTTWAWNQQNEEALLILRQKQNPQISIGHLSAFPVRKEISKQLIEGTLTDTTLPAEAVLPYGSDIPADLYIAVICIDKPYRRQTLHLLLSFFEQFLAAKRKAGQGRSLDKLFAEAGTTQGQKLLQRRGFHPCHKEHLIPCYYETDFSTIRG